MAFEWYYAKMTRQQHQNKSDLLALKPGGIVRRRKFQQSLIVFSCGPDGDTFRIVVEEMGLQNSNKGFFTETRYLDFRVKIPPPTIHAKVVFLQIFFWEDIKKKIAFYTKRKHTEITFKNLLSKGFSLNCQSYITFGETWQYIELLDIQITM